MIELAKVNVGLIKDKSEHPELNRNIVIIQEVKGEVWDEKPLLPFVWVRRYTEAMEHNWVAGFATDPLLAGWCYPEDLVDFAKQYLAFVDYVKTAKPKS